MRKKGVELSMNVIIIAAISLLVLVILAVLVINYVRNLDKGLKDCTAKAGTCKADPCDNAIEGPTCTEEKPYCCPVVPLEGGG